jgi:hypothetical protein
MGGSWIVVGASVLGLVSVLLIVGSLWASSSARKRPRPQTLVSGSYTPLPAMHPITEHTMITAAPMGGQTVIVAMHEPAVDQATQFLTVDDIFALADDRVEPTRVLAADEVLIVTPVEPVAHAPVIATPSEPVARAPVIATPRPSVVASPMPRSRVPSASIPAASLPRPASKPAVTAPSKFAPPDPSAFVKPPADVQPTPYVGYVAARRPGQDDDDDDDDDNDLETELVHQAELMRLMMKSKPPG